MKNKCVFCGTIVKDGDHHLVAQTLHNSLPNLSEQDQNAIKEIKIPVCRGHHEILEEQVRVYSNIIRCILENRPYNFAENLPYRKNQIIKLAGSIHFKEKK